MLAGTRRRLDRGRGEPGGPMRRSDDGVGTDRLGAPDEGPEVLGVLDPIQEKQERRRAAALQDVFQPLRGASVEVAGHPLVMLGVGDVVEPAARGHLDGDAPPAGQLHDLPQPGLVPEPLGDDQLASGAPCPKCLAHRVAPVEDVHLRNPALERTLRRASSAVPERCPRP